MGFQDTHLVCITQVATQNSPFLGGCQASKTGRNSELGKVVSSCFCSAWLGNPWSYHLQVPCRQRGRTVPYSALWSWVLPPSSLVLLPWGCTTWSSVLMFSKLKTLWPTSSVKDSSFLLSLVAEWKSFLKEWVAHGWSRLGVRPALILFVSR